MLTRRLAAFATAAVLIPSGALAGHHQWDFTEFFSNADGTVQFVEMIGAANNEHNLTGWKILSDSGGSLTFSSSLPSSTTAGKSLLVGTSAFAALTGAPTPDYILPDNFLDTTGDTTRYDGTTNFDVVTFGAMPTDGITSIDDTGGTATNSPTNFAGTSGSVDASSGSVPSLAGWGIALLLGAIVLVTGRRLTRSADAPA